MTEDLPDDSGRTTFARRKRRQSGGVTAGLQDHVAPQGRSRGQVVCEDGHHVEEGREPASATTAAKKMRKMVGTLQPVVASVDPSARRSSLASSTVPPRKKILTQMHLDFGQKNFHSTQCATCGFVYTAGKRDEERLHAAHHEKAVGRQVIKFRTMAPPGSTLVAADGVGGNIYVVQTRCVVKGPSERSLAGGGRPGGQDRKVHVEVGDMLERELGMCEGWATAGVRGKGVAMYLYVNGSKELVGCVVVEVDPVQATVGVMVDSEGRVEKRAGDEDGTRTVGNLRGTGKKKQCAVRVMWASKMHRRKKVVSALLDCVRGQLVPGQIIGRHDVAYSQPTRDGALFIAAYSGKQVQDRDTTPPRGPAGTASAGPTIEFWVYE